jgi:hypothetical protein
MGKERLYKPDDEDEDESRGRSTTCIVRGPPNARSINIKPPIVVMATGNYD